MNEKIVLKTGKEYPLAPGGTSSTPSTLRLIFQAPGPLEDTVTVFSDSAATAQIKVVNGDGSDIVNISLHFFLKDVRPMQHLVMSSSIVVA